MSENSNIKKIVIVSPSLKMGGIERALTVLANYFSSVGHEVIFISCQEGNAFYQLADKVTLAEFEYKRKAGIVSKIKFYYSLISFLRKKIKSIHTDCVLSFGDAFNPLVLLALYNTKVPVFISDRTSPDYNFNPVVNIGKQWLYPNAAGFIAQTQRAAIFNQNKFKGKLNIKIIPNAIKAVTMHPTISNENQIVYIGRLSKEKGVARLIMAYNKIKNKDWNLVLAGDGPEITNLMTLVKDLELTERVIFLGKVSQIDTLLAQSSIFVLPSFVEGFPNALCEAMSAGLPSICFDCIPHEEIIENGVNGIVVKNNDLEALTFAIDNLISNQTLRDEIGQNAATIAKKLDPEKIGNDYLNFILTKN